LYPRLIIAANVDKIPKPMRNSPMNWCNKSAGKYGRFGHVAGMKK